MAVVTLDLECEHVHPLDAAGVERNAVARIAASHDRGATGGAEVMASVDIAPDVARQAALFGDQPDSGGIHLPMKETGTPARRAVALDQSR